MDATQAIESDYINANLVQESKDKKLVILGEGKYEETDYGTKMVLPVKIDGKDKLWRVNKETAKNLIEAYGKDTIEWIGQWVLVGTRKINGMDTVIGAPPIDKVVKTPITEIRV